MKFKATGDLEKAKRFDKYSLGFLLPGLVFIILIVVLVALSPFLVGFGLFILY